MAKFILFELLKTLAKKRALARRFVDETAGPIKQQNEADSGM